MTMSMAALTALLMMMPQAPGPKGPAGSAAPGGALRSIDKGLDSQIDDARQVTIRSAADWEKLWRQHAGERARPPVDFGREIVIAVFLGSRPTAGFSIEIVGTREGGPDLIVQYRETRPPAGGIVAQVLTSPYHVVAMSRSDAVKDVKFEKIT
jgi:hypothetical protein